MKQEHIPLVRTWAATGMSLSKQCHAMAELTGADYSSPLFDAIWRERDAHTAALGLLINDECEWLNYFESECEFGDTPRQITYADGTKVMLDTVDKLIAILSDQSLEKPTGRPEF